MVKRILKFIFGGIVVMHALNSYTNGLAGQYKFMADKEEVKANGGDVDEFNSQYKYVFIPVMIYRNCKKIVNELKRWWPLYMAN